MRLVPVILLASCATLLQPPGRDDAALRFAEGGEEAALVLRAANTLSFEVLDDDVGLDVRAADNIVWVRSGDDRVDGTDDDAPFASLAALAEVPFVGPAGIEALYVYADALWGDAEIHGVVEGSALALAILDLVNRADHAVLQHRVGLDLLTACDIIDHRAGADLALGTDDDDRFDDLAELALLERVDAGAFAALREHVQREQTVVDCPPGWILSSDGQTQFTDLNSALAHAPDGTVYDVCEGTFSVEDATLHSGRVTLRGRGPGLTSIGHAVLYRDPTIDVRGDAELTLLDLSFAGCDYASNTDNVSCIDVHGALVADNVVFSGNRSRGHGVVESYGSVRLFDTTFEGNDGNYAGALDVSGGGTLVGERVRFEDNRARGSYDSSVLRINRGDVTLIDSVIWSNRGSGAIELSTDDDNSFTAENVDFGWGETDNAGSDLTLAKPDIRFHFGTETSIVCDANNCL